MFFSPTQTASWKTNGVFQRFKIPSAFEDFWKEPGRSTDDNTCPDQCGCCVLKRSVDHTETEYQIIPIDRATIFNRTRFLLCLKLSAGPESEPKHRGKGGRTWGDSNKSSQISHFPSPVQSEHPDSLQHHLKPACMRTLFDTHRPPVFPPRQM